MIIFRKRLIFWLVKEYLRKWGKVIPIYLLIGFALFFSIQYLLNKFPVKIPVGKKEFIGIAGAYTFETLPQNIIKDITYGLTDVALDGKAKPAAAKYWKIQDNGKTYVFYLRDNMSFSDGSKIKSNDINYNFSDVSVIKPNDKTIVFKLKDAYSPFLITASKPIFKNGTTGLGEYKIKSLKSNGEFIESITLVSKNNQYSTKTYNFYATYDALKTAYMLGEISEIKNLLDLNYKNIKMSNFKNSESNKFVNYSKLVALFINTQDRILSDKKLRNALLYAMPDTFSFGENNRAPYSKLSWAYQEDLGLYNKYTQDLVHAKVLLSNSDATSESGELKLEIKTLPKYKPTAEEIAKEWKKINITTTINLVNSLPSDFQLFLGDFNLPKDPDQYVLWHSGQENNISHYKNLRIDKFLEDGRKTINESERKNIYADFQKYLLDDSPAIFLYFPYEYDVKRK